MIHAVLYSTRIIINSPKTRKLSSKSEYKLIVKYQLVSGC